MSVIEWILIGYACISFIITVPNFMMSKIDIVNEAKEQGIAEGFLVSLAVFVVIFVVSPIVLIITLIKVCRKEK